LGCFCHFAVVNDPVDNPFGTYNFFHILNDLLPIDMENEKIGSRIIVKTLIYISLITGGWLEWIEGAG
jgi:hypothetical protein